MEGSKERREEKGGEGGGKEEIVTIGLSYKPALTMENTRTPSTLTEASDKYCKGKVGCFKHT